jgi:hypothetical protein
MASEIGLGCELCKYRSKKSLPQIVHLRCCKSRSIPIVFFKSTFITGDILHVDGDTLKGAMTK